MRVEVAKREVGKRCIPWV